MSINGNARCASPTEIAGPGSSSRAVSCSVRRDAFAADLSFASAAGASPTVMMPRGADSGSSDLPTSASSIFACSAYIGTSAAAFDLNVISMRFLAWFRIAIVAKARGREPIVRIGRALILTASVATAACYPHHDWRDYRPDCSRGWCGFTASFPGKVSNATRDIPVGATRLPLTVNVVTIDDVSFAVAAFDLGAGDEGDAARAAFERKILDDVGATSARRGRVTLHTTDRAELAADTFDAEGMRGDKALRATARFAERPHRLVEILVIGPAAEMSTSRGKQAIETFLASVRLD